MDPRKKNHRLAVITLDDQRHEVTTRTFMCTADKVAFERHFGISAASIARLKDQFDEKGNPIPGADLSEYREEHIAFFVWRALVRGLPEGMVNRDFSTFLDNAAELELENLAKEDQEGAPAAPDPTGQAPAAG